MPYPGMEQGPNGETLRAPAGAASAGKVIAATGPASGGVVPTEWADAAGEAADNRVTLLVFWGSSNAGGYALNSDATAPELAVRPQVQIWNNTTGGFESLDVGTNNLLGHAGLESFATTRHGWELQLANSVAAGDWEDDTVYLVKTGQGSSVISQWNDGGTYDDLFVERMDGAIAAIKALGKTPLVQMWTSHGINDDVAGTSQATYEAGLTDFIARQRARYGFFPVIMAGFTTDFDVANAALTNVAANVPLAYFVDTSDLALISGDPYHWGYASMKTMSTRLTDVSLNIVGESDQYVQSQAGVFSETLYGSLGTVANRVLIAEDTSGRRAAASTVATINDGTASLQVAGNVTVTGAISQFIFYDRTSGVSKAWGWSADSGIARLYSVEGGTFPFTLTSAGLATVASMSVSDEAYGVGWNGSFTVPTKNAVYDKIASLAASDISDFSTAALTAAPAETTATVGSLINGATEKTTPVDADFVGLMDSAASNILKKLSWANIKATAKTYFDTLYQALHANLTAFAGLSLVADRLPYANGTGTLTLTTFTAAGRAIIDDADAAAQRVTMGVSKVGATSKWDGSVADATYDLYDAAFAHTLLSGYVVSESGTATVNLKIGSTNITGGASISVSSTPTNVTLTANNSAVEDDIIRAEVTSGSSLVGLKVVLKGAR